MEKFTLLFNVYFLNGLAAVGLAFIHFNFYKLFSPTEKAQARFFLFLSLGWLINLLYLGFMDISSRVIFYEDSTKYSIVRCLNTVSYYLFLQAAAWQLRPILSGLFRNSIIAPIALLSLAGSLLSIPFPEGRAILNVPAVLFGIAAIIAIGINYHIYFATTRKPFRKFVTFTLVYSMYMYGLLQVCVFLMPPYTSYWTQRVEHVSEYLFLAGMFLKLIHIVGLSSFGTEAFRDYERKLDVYDRAKMSVILADQLAHELRTPATELKVRVASAGGASHADRGEHARVLSIVEQITSLLNVFDKFQRDQRVDYRVQAAPAPHNLNSLCDSVIFSLKITMRPNCSMEKAYASGPVTFGVETELTQIVRNIIKNSIEAVDGHIQRGSPGKVSVKTEVDVSGKVVVLRVTDNGMGIDDAVYPRIFEEGFSTKGGLGRGHGLYIARTIARRWGGEVEAVYVKGEKAEKIVGAQFRLILPLYQEQQGRGVQHATHASPR